MKFKRSLVYLVACFLLASCVSEGQIKDKVTKVIKENPSIIHEAIKADPAGFLEVLQEAADQAKEKMAEKRREQEKRDFEESFNNPLEPEIRDDESFRGPKDAQLTLVEYSDFECPYCKRGYETVLELMEKYKGKIRFVYKHLPLSFHPNAMIASKYYEAIRLQSEDKAFKFHDKIFDQQQKLRKGEPFLKSLAKELNVNMTKLQKDLESEKVEERIQEDIAEAAKFGIQGTPGFVFNGIPVKGAYPVSHFEKIVEELKNRNMVDL